MFISIEGIDFSGKTTQARLLRDFLVQKGIDVLLVREPGGTAISEKIRSLLLDRANSRMLALTELLLYSASRAQLVGELIRPALAAGKCVICDRFADSSTAYQGFARNLGMDKVETVNAIATSQLAPDLTILIDVPVDVAIERSKRKGTTEDRLELEGPEFFGLVRQGYLQVATRHQSRFKVVDGKDDIETVQSQIRAIVVERFNLH